VPDLPDLLAEAPFSVRNEQAATVADVLLRRTRLGLLAARDLVAGEAARAVAEAMAPELGWDAGRVDQELARWGEVAAAEGIAVPVPADGAAAAEEALPAT
jgi:glycerol-3-phosphate dehydrogenase